MNTVIRYFISFSFTDTHGPGTGNAELSRSAPIRSMADIETIAATLREQGLHDPVILSFSRFDGDVA
jgi:hypothetical protein